MSTPSRRVVVSLMTAATAATCLAAAAIPATPALGDQTRASHGDTRTVHVTGLLTLKNADTGEYAATGDLVGTWRIPPARAKDYYNSPTTIIQKGTESFDGCLTTANQCGTFNSDYISWTYQQANKRLITGGCVHAPTGGTSRSGRSRGFIGLRGLLIMKDTPVGDVVNTVYEGDLILNAMPDEGSLPIPRADTAKAAARTTPGSC